jgi:hypothetical protein
VLVELHLGASGAGAGAGAREEGDAWKLLALLQGSGFDPFWAAPVPPAPLDAGADAGAGADAALAWLRGAVRRARGGAAAGRWRVAWVRRRGFRVPAAAGAGAAAAGAGAAPQRASPAPGARGAGQPAPAAAREAAAAAEVRWEQGSWAEAGRSVRSAADSPLEPLRSAAGSPLEPLRSAAGVPWSDEELEAAAGGAARRP